VILALAVIAGHLILVSSFIHWWGGHSFGPRFTTGLVPWFVLLGILGLQARLISRAQDSEPRRRIATRTEIGAGAFLLMASMIINGLGAIDSATWFWNVRPVNIDEYPERNWDWHQPQFLAGFVLPSPPHAIPIPGGKRIEFSSKEADGYIWYGWSATESQFRWTEAKEVALVFRVNEIRHMLLTMRVAAFVVQPVHPEQRVNITLNGRPLEQLSLDSSEPREVAIDLPADLLRSQNSLEFALPDATSPRSLGLGGDDRPLGIAVYWIQFESKH
jgi:hypothetical protein